MTWRTSWEEKEGEEDEDEDGENVDEEVLEEGEEEVRKIKTRLIDEMFPSVMCEFVFLK
jgi:hypothetical protein